MIARKMGSSSVNKTYTVVICTLCVAAMFLIHALCRPRIREGNSHQVNIYGEQGAQHLPHAIVIGVRKAGTRAILSYLRRHPDIRIARSEVHFFSQWRNYRQGIEWYRGVMPYSRPDQITVEKTPAYFHTPGVPERIHAMNSSVKLILCVRDPVKRAVSDYLQFSQKIPFFSTVYSFEDVTKPDNYFSGFIKRSNYITILEEWLKYFPKEQILVIDGDKLGKDPINEMHLTENFLGVKHYLDDRMFVFNEEKKFYCVKNHPEDEPHCLGDSKGRTHPEIDENVRKQLVEYYKPYNEKLFELIGRRFDWTSS